MIKSIFILVVGVMVVTQALDCLNGPPIKNVHPSSCCKMPRIKDFSTMGDCYKKVGIDVDIMEGSKSGKMERGGFKESKDYHGPHGHHGHHGHHLGNDNERQCLDECLLTDWKVMKDGSIDVSAAIAKAKSMFMNDAKWSVILENGVTFCAAEAEKNKDNFVKALNGTKPDGMKNCRFDYFLVRSNCF